MARARKSHVTDEEKAKNKLEPAYSAKVDGHRYVIYCTYARTGDPIGKVLVLKFYGTHAAKQFVERVIAKDEYEWELWLDRDAMIVTSRGVKVRAHKDQLKDIMNHEYTEAEIEWRDDQLIRSVANFLYGRRDDNDSTRSHDTDDAGRSTIHDDGSGSDVQSKTPKSARKDRLPKREPKPKPNTDGFISANDIAQKLKLEGREVRGVLRALKLTKPDHGWSWPKDEAGKIEKKVVDQLAADLKARNKAKKK